MKPFFRIFALVILLFLALGGIYGGWMLISDPSGASFQWSINLLDGTPFTSFLVPGIVLLSVNGVLPFFIAVLVLAKHKSYPLLILLQGIVLIGWLTAEVIFNADLYSPVMHPLFYAIGTLLILVGLKLKSYKSYKVESAPKSRCN